MAIYCYKLIRSRKTSVQVLKRLSLHVVLKSRMTAIYCRSRRLTMIISHLRNSQTPSCNGHCRHARRILKDLRLVRDVNRCRWELPYFDIGLIRKMPNFVFRYYFVTIYCPVSMNSPPHCPTLQFPPSKPFIWLFLVISFGEDKF